MSGHRTLLAGADPRIGRAQRVGPDLRLAVPAVSLWAALLVAARMSPAVALAVAGCGAFVSVVALIRMRASLVLVACVAGILCAAAGFAVSGLRAEARTNGPLAGLGRRGAIAELTVELATDPTRHEGADSFTGRPYTYVLASAQVTQVDSGGRRWRLRQPVLLLASDTSWLGLLPGQQIRTAGQVHLPRPGDTVSAVIDVRGPPHPQGRPPALQRAAGTLRAGLRQAASGLPAGQRALLPGLVDGDTSAMSAATVRDFQRTGLTHLVAVSGENVAIVSGVVVWLARRLRAGPRLAGMVALLSVLGFVVLARPSPSVLRAAVMGGLGLVGLVLSRPRSALTGLAGAVLVLLLIEPGLAAQAGFELSVSATLGLLIFAPGWRRVLARRMPDPVAAALAIPAAAQVACAPLIAMIGGGTSLVAVPANLLAAPAVGPATVFGVLSAATAPVAPWLARICAQLGGLPCAWLVVVAHVGSRLPFASIGWPAGVSGGLLLVAVSPFVVMAARSLIVGRASDVSVRAGPRTR